MIDYTSTIYTKFETELSWLIRQDAAIMIGRQDNIMTNLTGVISVEYNTQL